MNWALNISWHTWKNTRSQQIPASYHISYHIIKEDKVIISCLYRLSNFTKIKLSSKTKHPLNFRILSYRCLLMSTTIAGALLHLLCTSCSLNVLQGQSFAIDKSVVKWLWWKVSDKRKKIDKKNSNWSEQGIIMGHFGSCKINPKSVW